MRILGIIPVRYASTRLPGKALADIGGQSMVQRVYGQASLASSLDSILVATDDEKIFEHVNAFGGQVCMTSTDHPSGTDRCYEALTKQSGSYSFVINIQGDEPFIDPQQIEDLASSLTRETQIATLAKRIEDAVELSDPHKVKVIMDGRGEAIYFSRSPLPYYRGLELPRWPEVHDYYRHIGIYAYRADILKEITQLPVSGLEKAEGLEQLRWLENGYRIQVFKTIHHTTGIDTAEDLEQARKTHSQRN